MAETSNDPGTGVESAETEPRATGYSWYVLGVLVVVGGRSAGRLRGLGLRLRGCFGGLGLLGWCGFKSAQFLRGFFS